jgi:natural product biosynthesis luciferase-like monooxygenase protein
MKPKFSLFHLPTFTPPFNTSEAEFYREMLEQIERADAIGLHSTWFAEHHFNNYGGHIPSVAVFGAAVAQRTRRIRIGSGIALLPLQDPVRVAEEYAMLDCLSGGRLEFGIGRGFQKVEYDAFGRSMSDSRALFEDAHEIIVKAWTQERFSHESKFRKIENLRVIPKPVQKLPPFYVACIFTPDSFRWTGSKGYNLMVVPYAAPNPDDLTSRVGIFREAHKASGAKADGEVLAVYHFYCGETAEKAKEEPREPMMRYMQGFVAANQEDAYSTQYTPYAGLKGFIGTIEYEGYMYPNRVIIGDPEQCVARIREILASGVTNVSLLANFGGLAHDKVLASLDRFAKHVMPKFT